jgi:hypothetical protein
MNDRSETWDYLGVGISGKGKGEWGEYDQSTLFAYMKRE